MKFDPLVYSYPSKRHVIYGKKGMVATSQPLAAQAGLEILKKGGNAIDAAVAAAACLTVVEPTSNGIGGDLFALVWSDGKLYGLNSSGPAPKSISAEKLRSAGYKTIPKYGWIPVTVPGAPAGWAKLSERFGQLPFSDVLSPAVEYAQEGYAVSPVTSLSWQNAYKLYSTSLKGEEYKHWFDIFAPKGRAPKPGELWKSADHARSLASIGDSKAECFYRGDLADRIAEFSREYDGYLTKGDMAAFQPQWVDPISINYRGYDVWEIPPNGHGIVALMALNIVKGFEFGEKDHIETVHRQIEALKLAFIDGKRYLSDPASMNVTIEQLLAPAYAEERRRLIGKEALLPDPGTPSAGGTVYLATADSEGNMVSLIQSNYMGFGSGLVVPGTGIALHNRGHNFTLDGNHCNCIAGGKRPYHTIIPGFLTKAGKPVGPFGVMGAFMQPQGHMQVIMNTIDFHLNPQQALDAPRWQWMKGKQVAVEPGFPMHIAEQLQARGHQICIQMDTGSFGRGQIIWKTEEGTLCGGTEPRADGMVAVW
ncbi:MAG: gamma-glutamyltransferase family protein [Caldicoprobacterales bacterium]|jgi:gamma-glutamyltranspeptidase/glutathione hydrolase|nr:gamma-glutamyltransferase family protein [Clostridiales bacterium]